MLLFGSIEKETEKDDPICLSRLNAGEKPFYGDPINYTIG